MTTPADRTLGRPAPNEDKDQNAEQLKTRRKGTLATKTEPDRQETERRAARQNTPRTAPGA